VLAVGVALGNTSYGGNLGTNANFKRLQSATVDVKLGSGAAYTVQQPQSQVGAIYSGLVVGVSAGGRVVKPLSERWPTANGTFALRLPGSVRGKTLSFWENDRQAFSSIAARPGGPVDVSAWPVALGDSVPRGLAALRVR
jgi:hypothetical protein